MTSLERFVSAYESVPRLGRFMTQLPLKSQHQNQGLFGLIGFIVAIIIKGFDFPVNNFPGILLSSCSIMGYALKCVLLFKAIDFVVKTNLLKREICQLKCRFKYSTGH